MINMHTHIKMAPNTSYLNGNTISNNWLYPLCGFLVIMTFGTEMKYLTNEVLDNESVVMI